MHLAAGAGMQSLIACIFAGDDAKILRDLFEGTGVMSALDHTKIEGANDPQLVAAEAEAAQVARRAAEALRRSRQACQVRLLPALPIPV